MKIKSVYRRIRDYLFFSRKKIKRVRVDLDKAAIVLMGTPEYNNIGDHGIAYATKMFIIEHFPNTEFIEVTENELRYKLKQVKQLVGKRDIILLQGGGNLGDLYQDQEKIRKIVLSNFTNNSIILMPQTVSVKEPSKYFSKINKYSDRLVIFAREVVSYKIIKDHFEGECFLAPDIVMFLKGRLEEEKAIRRGINICLRNDKESANPTGEIECKVKKILTNLGKSYGKIDMIEDKSILLEERIGVLKNKFKEYAHSKLIITDRLHGMIFSYVTRTPCIAFPTNNHKLTSSYKWLEECGYIKLCLDVNDLGKYIEDLEIVDDENVVDDCDYIEIVNCISKNMKCN